MRKRLFIYYACCTGIYLALFLLELFVFDPLLEFIGNTYFKHLMVYAVLLLIINPILVKLISQKLSIAHISKGDERSL